MAGDTKSTRTRAVRLSSGVVVVRDTPQGYIFLLLRAFRNWDFPKGMVEANEQPLAAAVREVGEETAIADLKFVWGDDYVETGPYTKSKVARYYLASTMTDEIHLLVNPILDRAEHQAFCWATADEARALLTERVVIVLDWAVVRLREAGVRLA